MMKRHCIAAFCSLLLIAADINAAPAKGKAAVKEDDGQRTVTVLSMSHRYDLNPHTASYTSEAQLLSGLYEGLFSYDPATLEPLNALCTSYKISRNKKRWTFTLRSDAKFSNGEAITAKSVRDSWLKLLATKDAPYASLLDSIEGARAYRTGSGKAEDVGIIVRNDTTLVVHLEEPAEHLPRILCHHAFCVLSKKQDAYSGPFMLKSYKDEKLEMVKNPYYYGAAQIRIPGVTIVQSDDLDENAYLFNTGKIDWISEANANAAKIINRDSVQVFAEFGTYFIFFKMQNKPWNSKEFREALLEAVPYDKLREGITVPASTLVYPLSGYPSVTGFEDYDADDAIALMNKARERAGLSYDERITITFGISENEFMKTLAEKLKAAWQPLGVDLVVETAPVYDYNARIPEWDADIFSYSWIGDFADPLAFLELFRSDSSLNVSNYNNAAFDDLLVQASRADSSEEHNALLAKAESMLLDDCMLIPVYHPVSMHFIDLTCIGGWQPNALDLHPYKYLYIKKPEPTTKNLVRFVK